jgi:hypothetical protein
MQAVRSWVKSVALAGVIVAGATSAWGDRPLLLIFPFSGKCVDIAHASNKNGARAIQFECRNQSNQRWFFRPTAYQNEYEIVNERSGKCLEISEGSGAQGAPAQQWVCNHNNHQRFRLISNGTSDGYAVYIFQVVHSSQCLDVKGGTTVNGAQIIQYECTGGTNQNIYKKR